ncbi:SMI1/KNR4 family protein [Streptomyces sp. NPDC050418]|uniref:SMI1/KNR4 family protein n=1 Tax=Streptomyces sp. NPDC050418 TaxID=3365612 RepID=UPI0037A3823D
MSEESSRWFRGRMVVGPFAAFERAEFEAVEQAVGLPVPESYRLFLEEAGGARLPYAVHVPGCEPSPVQGFDELHRLGRNRKDEYGWGTLVGEYQKSREWWLADEVPLAGLLPIARNGGSDTVFLDLNPGAGHGQVCAFVHGTPLPGYMSQGVFAEVADSFDDFLDRLIVDPDLAEHSWSDVAEREPTDPWRLTVEEWLDKEVPQWRDEPWAR